MEAHATQQTEATPTIKHLFVSVNGIEMHVAEAKPDNASPTAPLAICLHGFPEYWGAWQRQLPALLNAGYRVWMPDMRGYGRSECPPKVADYRTDILADDIAGLIQASGTQRCMLIAHDWGAMVAWFVAAKYPELIEKMVIANVPHPRVMRRTVFRSLRQFLASWYVFFFQLPFLPELLLSLFNFKLLSKIMTSSANENSFSAEDMEGYRAAWRKSGLSPMLAYYRAALRHQHLPPEAPITVKILILWGKKDWFLTCGMANRSVELCNDGALVFFEEATHWVQHDVTQQFNEKLISFLGLAQSGAEQARATDATLGQE